ncbi:MAG: hypothetical protein ABSF45_05110, partial [Terriglobia bacterium]
SCLPLCSGFVLVHISLNRFGAGCATPFDLSRLTHEFHGGTNLFSPSPRDVFSNSLIFKYLTNITSSSILR